MKYILYSKESLISLALVEIKVVKFYSDVRKDGSYRYLCCFLLILSLFPLIVQVLCFPLSMNVLK